jgi:N1-aminopropylagmatine ureohydrolase
MTHPIHDDPGAFTGLPGEVSYQKARFAVLPVAYDGTSTWLKGADRGPEAILSASANMELYDIETDSEPWRSGIITMAPMEGFPTPEIMTETVRDATRELLADGKVVVGIGGEHSISIGMIQAHADHFDGLMVLQFDAHADSRDEYEGSRFNHACVMARVAEICPAVQVGIRSLDASERENLHPSRTFFAHKFTGSEADIHAILEQLKGPLYITIDLDVLDPSEMPSTGTPEPGGLSYRQLTGILKHVCRKFRVVGFDVVELLPIESNKAPDFLAARIIYQLMAYINKSRIGE